MSSTLLDHLPYDPRLLFDKPLVEITTSSMSTFQTCIQKYVFRYLMQLAPRQAGISLAIGTAFHAGMACILRFLATKPHRGTKLALSKHLATLQLAHDAIDKVWDKYIENVDNIMGSNTDKLPQAQAQAHACLEAWWHAKMPDFADTHNVILVEQIVRAQPLAKVGSDIRDRMAGVIDAVIQEKKTKAIKIMEHKTRGSGFGGNPANLDMDSQSIWYTTIAPFVLPKRCQAPSGFIYNVVIKPRHRAGNTWQELKQRMVDAMITEPEQYFVYSDVIVTEDVVLAMLRNNQRVINRMDSLQPDHVEMSTKACSEYNGCPYAPLCRSGADAGNPCQVLEMAQTELFAIITPHSELGNVIGDED
jgi:uncharacterized protein YgiB involved in biofilm formation